MKKNSIFIVIIFWYLIVGICIYDVHPKTTPILSFPIQQGSLTLIDTYKGHNLVSLRDKVYVIPHGVPFINPKRTSYMKEMGQLTSSSIEEGRRMIDSKPNLISNDLTFVEKINFFNIYRFRYEEKFIIVPDRPFTTKKTSYKAYSEIPYDDGYDKINEFINSL